MVARELPRFVITKPLKRGLSYYWNLPVHFRKLGCTIAQEHQTSLGVDYVAACGKARRNDGGFRHVERRALISLAHGGTTEDIGRGGRQWRP
jgi:hypothetical protein